MARMHSRTLPMIKIVGRPGEREKTYHTYEQMTYAELKSERSNMADQVLEHYYDHNYRGKVHLCGSCDYFSYCGRAVRVHIASHHPPTTHVYKIIEYPPVTQVKRQVSWSCCCPSSGQLCKCCCLFATREQGKQRRRMPRDTSTAFQMVTLR